MPPPSRKDIAKTTINAQTGTLVLKDGAGDYYLLPLAALERGRVREEDKPRLEQIIAEQDDVHGHLIGLVVIAFTALALADTGHVFDPLDVDGAVAQYRRNHPR